MGMAKAESDSDVLARRVGGGLLLVVSLIGLYMGLWLGGTRGHRSPLDLDWIEHFGFGGTEPIGLGGAAVAALFAVVSVHTIIRRKSEG